VRGPCFFSPARECKIRNIEVWQILSNYIPVSVPHKQLTFGIAMEYFLAPISIRIQRLHVPDVSLFLLPQRLALPIQKGDPSIAVETYDNRQFAVSIHITGR